MSGSSLPNASTVAAVLVGASIAALSATVAFELLAAAGYDSGLMPNLIAVIVGIAIGLTLQPHVETFMDRAFES
jgi:hypothetical protein